MSSTRTVSLQNSAPRAGVVKGISYTIGDDAPWTVPVMEAQTSPREVKAPTYIISETQQQTLPDHGPPTTRQTRLPIFDQVRSMLNKPPTAHASPECDQTPADFTDASMKPSTWDNMFSTRRYSPNLKSLKSKKNQSNISVLRDSETSSLASGQSSQTSSPARNMALAPTQISVNAVSQLPRGVTAKNQVKRKPVVSLSPSASENFPPQDLLTVPDTHPNSRFSWSTVAPSETAGRRSTDTTATDNGRPSLASHFSWTTIGTSAGPTPMEEFEDPTALPPMPSPQLEQSYFRGRPNESILSRKRPVQRLDKEEWAPSTPRQRATTNSSNDSTPRATPATTPRARQFSIGDETLKHSATNTPSASTHSSGKKVLPLLPFMSEKQASHVETLLTQEKNIVMQRRNIERAIADLEKVERASPLEVPFAAVRDAKRKLEECRETLREVKLEEMDIGIKIARARRREDFGEGEGTLWVRRVTG
jgi:hypothetical protein